MPNVCVIEIKVTDIVKGRKFYTEVLDFEVTSEKYLPDVLVLGHEGPDLILHIAEEPIEITYPQSAQSLLFFQVADIHAADKKLKDNGVEIIEGPAESPPGPYLVFRDPFGNVHGLMEIKDSG